MKNGLIMEGGAMRGIFTCGVIDTLMAEDISFDGAAGISAGGCFGCNYKSRQPWRVLRYLTTYARDPRYGGLGSLLRTGNIFNVDFCYHKIPEELDPFDWETFDGSPMEFYVGAVDVRTGKMHYHRSGQGDHEADLLWLQASASMPLVSTMVNIHGNLYLDGGIVDSIPYKFMEKKGYDRNIVILTQPEGYIKKRNPLQPIIRESFKEFPEFVKASAVRHLHYNVQSAYVRQKEEAGEAIVLCPPASLGIGRMESDPRELIRVYDIGRQVAEENLDRIKAFLG